MGLERRLVLVDFVEVVDVRVLRVLEDIEAETARLVSLGAEQAAKLRFEIAFCEGYLPKGLEEAAVRALVQERMRALGIADVKQVGRLVGVIMKTHKGQVEAADVKRLAEGLLKS